MGFCFFGRIAISALWCLVHLGQSWEDLNYCSWGLSWSSVSMKDKRNGQSFTADCLQFEKSYFRVHQAPSLDNYETEMEEIRIFFFFLFKENWRFHVICFDIRKRAGTTAAVFGVDEFLERLTMIQIVVDFLLLLSSASILSAGFQLMLEFFRWQSVIMYYGSVMTSFKNLHVYPGGKNQW